MTRERADVRRKAEESLEKLVRVVSGKRERKREGGQEERAEGGRKESWQLLGACGVGPFKARSPDAWRRNCPPRVSPTP